MADILHFKGLRTELDFNHFMGPDNFGGHYLPVSAVYDKESDMTTVEVVPLFGDELNELRMHNFGEKMKLANFMAALCRDWDE